MSRAPRVVLDTNVALSALVSLFSGDRNPLSLASEFFFPVVDVDQFVDAPGKV